MAATLRLLVFSQRYWPLMDDRVRRLVCQVVALRRQGVEVHVATASTEHHWPAMLEHQEVPIFRPAPYPQSHWSFGSYHRTLAKWLKLRLQHYDAVYVDQLREETPLVVDAAREARLPCVVRCDGYADGSDWAWWNGTRRGHKEAQRVFAADAIIAPNGVAAQQLLIAGAREDQIQRIDDTIPAQVTRTQPLRSIARRALGELCYDLDATDDAPVILCLSRISRTGGAAEVTQAISPLLQRMPNLRVWLIGDGAGRLDLENELRLSGLRHNVVTPGSFDDVDELIQAADLMVIPRAADGLQYHLPAALAAGLPVIAPHDSEVQRWMGDDAGEATFVPGDVLSMRRAIRTALSDYAAAQSRASAIRQDLLTRRPIGRSSELLLRVLRGCARSGGWPKSSTFAEVPQ
jgi:glycosyltransferase involved in cell wall biosynthesis